MNILGISAYYHDSAAVLIKNGKVVTAVEEERYSRIKHDSSFPSKAIEYCLKANNLVIKDIDYISYYEKPLLKFERILETFVNTYPFSVKPFLKGIPEWLTSKIKVEQTIRKKLHYEKKIYFMPHHISHASVAFYPSPFKKAAILTIDGVGEYQTTGLWKGEGTQITLLKRIDFPHSLGLLYSTFTSFLGFRVNEDEYKLMGLAAYGKPIYAFKIKKLIEIKPDGSFKLDLSYFAFREEFSMWNKKFEELFGKPRNPSDSFEKHHKDIAASIQTVTEEVYFKILNHLYKLTNCQNLCVSGGVALNALANGKIYTRTLFKNACIFGAAGDNGAAIGSALYTYHSILNQPIRKNINTLYLGSSYSDKTIETELKKNDLLYKKFKNKQDLITVAVQLLKQGKIIGWFQGRMEFGPRALGSRSILAMPNPKSMKERVNIIKIREQFRPFAGSILQEKIHDYFEVPEKSFLSPFMTFCFHVKEEKRNKLAAIVHIDSTCRIQTVNKNNGIYYDLIKKLYEVTGIPCILNTSFNLKGEPIVEKPEQALKDFLKTEINHLVIGNFIISKFNHKE